MMKKSLTKILKMAITSAMLCATLPCGAAHAEPLLYSSFDSEVENYFSSLYGEPAVRDTEVVYRGTASAKLEQQSENDALKYDIPISFEKGIQYRISAKVLVDEPASNSTVRFQITGETENGVTFSGFSATAVNDETWYRNTPTAIEASEWMELSQVFTVSGGAEDTWNGKIAVWVTGDDVQTFHVDDFTLAEYKSVDEVIGAGCEKYYSFEDGINGIDIDDGTITADRTIGYESAASAKISINHNYRWLGGLWSYADFAEDKWYKFSAKIYADADTVSSNAKARFWIIDTEKDLDFYTENDWTKDNAFSDRYVYYSNNFTQLKEGWNEVNAIVRLNSEASDAATLKLIVEEPTQDVKFTYNVDDYKIEQIDVPEYCDDFEAAGSTCNWYDYASAVSYDSTMKALKVEKSASYGAAGHSMYLQSGKNYIAKAKVYVPSASSSGATVATLCVVNTYNINNDSTYYARADKDIVTDTWMELEALVNYNSDSGEEFDSRNLIVNIDSNGSYYVKDVELYSTSVISKSTFELGTDDWNEYATSIEKTTDPVGSEGVLKITKGAGYGRIYKSITLENNKCYKLKGSVFVPSGQGNDDEPAKFGIMSDYTLYLGNPANYTVYQENSVIYDQWFDIEKDFRYTGETGEAYLISSIEYGSGLYYYINDITVEEVEFGLYDGTFDDGIGEWDGFGAALATSDDYVYGTHSKSLKVYNRSASYTFAYHEVKLESGNTYTMSGKIFIPGDNTEAEHETKFMLNTVQGNTNLNSNCIAYDSRNIGEGTWEDFETTFEYNGDGSTLYITFFPHVGVADVPTYYISDIELYRAGSTAGLTAEITSVTLDENLNPSYTFNANTGYIIQYSYTCDGETVRAGYIMADEPLPVLKNASGIVTLSLTPILYNGKTGTTAVSDEVSVNGSFEITSLTINDGASTDPISYMRDIGEDGIYTSISYKNQTNGALQVYLVMAFYDADNRLIGTESEKKTLNKGEGQLEWPSDEESTLSVPENAAKIAAFIWDCNLTPYACYRVRE